MKSLEKKHAEDEGKGEEKEGRIKKSVKSKRKGRGRGRESKRRKDSLSEQCKQSILDLLGKRSRRPKTK